MTFDLLWWVAVAWCVACLLRTQNPRWWLGIGTAVGLGMLSKFTMAFFVAGLLGGMLLTSNRRYLRSPWFWCGVGVATVILLPVLIWQFQYHFVGLAWMENIHARDLREGRTDYFLPSQFWRTTNPVTVPLWLAGLWFLFATPAGKPFRMLGWMYVIPLILFLAARGRDYYLAPAYPMLLAAGAVWAEGGLSSLSQHSRAAAIRTTWTTLAVTVARVRDSLPATERVALGVLAVDEGEAGAVNLYGRAYGLPEAISGMNSNWLRGYGNPQHQTVITVSFTRDELDRIFASCTWAASLPRPYGIVNETIGARSDV